jgi:hypothetical protein
MSDDIGLWQHARGSAPNPAFGYCVDDVARAMVVDVLHYRGGGSADLDRCIRRSLRFVNDGFDGATGKFRNMRTAGGRWLANEASEDCHARALRGLAAVMAGMPGTELADRATMLFAKALPAAASFGAMRAVSAVILACDSAIGAGFPAESIFEPVAASLSREFDGAMCEPGLRPVRLRPVRLVALQDQGKDARGSTALAEWPWPEPVLTYENAIVPHALIAAGTRLGDAALTARGCAILDWLIDVQTDPSGVFSPIGNSDWWHRGCERSRFDQQPIEAATLISAAAGAFTVTGRRRYLDAAEAAYGWFLGDNLLGAMMADPTRGACFDGLGPTGPNENQGAESTLMWLTALEHMRELRASGELNPDRRTHS